MSKKAAPEGEKRRRGRPARAGENSTMRIELRLTPEERAALEALARASGETVSALLRKRAGLGS